MNPLVMGQLSQILGKSNLMHMLQVLMGNDEPDEGEIKDFQFLLNLLEAPVAGDYAWEQLTSWLNSKGYGPMVLGLMGPSMQRLKIEMEAPKTLDEARPAFKEVLTAIINHPGAPAKLAGITACPQCQYVYGLTQ